MEHSQVVAEGRLEILKELAEQIVSGFSCSIIQQPSPGMIMVKNTDPIEKTEFFLGEAYVTRCEAEVEGKLGYCCILGDEPERAVYGAILDGLIGNGLKVPENVKQLLEDELMYIQNKWEEENRRISKTKVQFDVKKG